MSRFSVPRASQMRGNAPFRRGPQGLFVQMGALRVLAAPMRIESPVISHADCRPSTSVTVKKSYQILQRILDLFSILNYYYPQRLRILNREGGYDVESIRERVGAYIERTGMTKGELAERLGMSRVTLHSKLMGQTEFRFSEAQELAEILGCSIDELRISPFEQSD